MAFHKYFLTIQVQFSSTTITNSESAHRGMDKQVLIVLHRIGLLVQEIMVVVYASVSIKPKLIVMRYYIPLLLDTTFQQPQTYKEMVIIFISLELVLIHSLRMFLKFLGLTQIDYFCQISFSLNFQTKLILFVYEFLL